MEELLTAEELMKILKFTNIVSIYRLVRAKKIDYVVIGREYRFTKEAVEQYLNQRTVSVTPPKANT